MSPPVGSGSRVSGVPSERGASMTEGPRARRQMPMSRCATVESARTRPLGPLHRPTNSRNSASTKLVPVTSRAGAGLLLTAAACASAFARADAPTCPLALAVHARVVATGAAGGGRSSMRRVTVGERKARRVPPSFRWCARSHEACVSAGPITRVRRSSFPSGLHRATSSQCASCTSTVAAAAASEIELGPLEPPAAAEKGRAGIACDSEALRAFCAASAMDPGFGRAPPSPCNRGSANGRARCEGMALRLRVRITARVSHRGKELLSERPVDLAREGGSHSSAAAAALATLEAVRVSCCKSAPASLPLSPAVPSANPNLEAASALSTADLPS
mmetsp:Transcript_32472/g.80793  ORF Transcript_32472/g.80793 Transcript_32472/m.80793 type:complete len:333 (-) Transcript_32472:187-1185(-)